MIQVPHADDLRTAALPTLGGGGRLLWLRFFSRAPVQLALLLAFLFLVHVPRITTTAVSHDERGALAICSQPISQITTQFYEAQNHPLFSILAAGSVRVLPFLPLSSARIVAFLAGVGVMLAFYVTSRSWVGREAALLTAFLLAVADPLHHYVTAARGYTMFVLGVVGMNHFLLQHLRSGRLTALLCYGLVAVATGYTHLWALSVMIAHAGFLAWERFWNRDLAGSKRWIAALSVMIVGAGVVLFLYAPMFDDMRRIGADRYASRLTFAGALGDALLQLARFGNWTLAGYVFVVPIFLEGCARKYRHAPVDRTLRLHLAVIVGVLTGALVLAPRNFECRYLLGVIPSAASLFAWGISGYWLPRRSEGVVLLPRAATWLAAFALGVLSANASMSANIPQSGMHTDEAGREHGYFYRNLPKAVGAPTAGVLLAVALAVILLRHQLPPWLTQPRAGKDRLRLAVVMGLLLASLPPLVLGPDYFQPRWLFEVHTVATAATWLLAWEHRGDIGPWRVLPLGLLITAGVAGVWQFGGDQLRFDAHAALRLAALLPPVLVVAAAAQASEPCFERSRAVAA